MSRNISSLTMVLLLLMSAFQYGRSQERPATAAAPRVPLTVEQAVKLGMENSKSLHASAAKVEAADARETEVKSARLPSLKFNSSYTRLSDVPPFTISVPMGPTTQTFTVSPSILNNYSMKLSLQQPIFTGFRLENAANAAEFSTRATEQDFAKDKSDLAYNVKAAYWNLYKANEIKKVIDETVDQVKAHLNDVTSLMNQGMATNNDVLRVQVQLSNAQLQQIDATNNVRLATIALDNVMGISLATEIDIASLPPGHADTARTVAVQPNLAPLDSYLRKAGENRPEVKAMDFRVRAGEAGVSAAKGNWWPQIFVAGNYNYARPNQRLVPTQDVFKDTWDLSLVASWDLWNWGATSSQTTQAQSQLVQARDAQQQVQDAVTLDVTQNYLTVQQSAERIGVSSTAVNQAKENYRVTSEKFHNGLALNTDMLDAEISLMQARWNYTQSLVDYELAQARLAKAAGDIE